MRTFLCWFQLRRVITLRETQQIRISVLPALAKRPYLKN